MKTALKTDRLNCKERGNNEEEMGRIEEVDEEWSYLIELNLEIDK